MRIVAWSFIAVAVLTVWVVMARQLFVRIEDYRPVYLAVAVAGVDALIAIAMFLASRRG